MTFIALLFLMLTASAATGAELDAPHSHLTRRLQQLTLGDRGTRGNDGISNGRNGGNSQGGRIQEPVRTEPAIAADATGAPVRGPSRYEPGSGGNSGGGKRGNSGNSGNNGNNGRFGRRRLHANDFPAHRDTVEAAAVPAMHPALAALLSEAPLPVQPAPLTREGERAPAVARDAY